MFTEGIWTCDHWGANPGPDQRANFRDSFLDDIV